MQVRHVRIYKMMIVRIASESLQGLHRVTVSPRTTDSLDDETLMDTQIPAGMHSEGT